MIIRQIREYVIMHFYLLLSVFDGIGTTEVLVVVTIYLANLASLTKA